MKSVASLEVDGAHYYLVYPGEHNSWGTNCSKAKLWLCWLHLARKWDCFRRIRRSSCLCQAPVKPRAWPGGSWVKKKPCIFGFTRWNNKELTWVKSGWFSWRWSSKPVGVTGFELAEANKHFLVLNFCVVSWWTCGYFWWCACVGLFFNLFGL